MHSVPSCALLFIYFLVVSDMLIRLEQHPDIQARIFGYKDGCSVKLGAKPFSLYIQLQMGKWILAIHYHKSEGMWLDQYDRRGRQILSAVAFHG